MHKPSVARMLLVPCLLLALAGCGGPAPAAVQPSVRIVAPINGLKEVGVGRVAGVGVTVRLVISHFTLVSSATGDKAGTGQVWLYENGKFLSEMATTSLSIVLHQPGSYRLTAVLVTNGKVVASSAPIGMSVTSPPVSPVATSPSTFGAAWTKACDAQPPTTTTSTQGLKPGTITLFCKGFAANSVISGLSTATNGDLWFLVSGGGPGLEIGRISPSGLTLFTKGLPAGLSDARCGEPGFAPGPDGNMWVIKYAQGGTAAAIARITPSGVITLFSKGLPAGAAVVGLQAGPQGDMWFRIQGGPSNYGPNSANSIGRITPSGVITVFTKGLTANSQVSYLTTGPDGNLWFTDQTLTGSSTGSQVPGPSSIGRITPSGVITLFSKGLPANSQISYPGLMTGPDGNLWFTDQTFTVSSTGSQVPGPTSIGRITPSGVITMFTTGLPANSNISGLMTGPDGNLWFTDGNSIGRITPSGAITMFAKSLPANSAGAQISQLMTGPDGNLWFTDGNSIGRITPSGVITVFTKGLPADNGGVSNLVTGPDGNLWFEIYPPSGPQPMVMGRLIP